MKIYITSIFVNDQSHALDFYSEKMGFELKNDIPLGEHRWLTMVSKEQADGVELLLEPNAHPAVEPYRSSLVKDGIPAASFQVEDLAAEHKRLVELGVRFTQIPMNAGPVQVAVLDDTCGNLIQLVQMNS